MTRFDVISEDDLLQLAGPQLTRHVFSKFTGSGIASIEVDACYRELLKFLYLTSKYPKLKANFIPVTKGVDEYWHEIILQTRQYQKLCERLPGGGFVHHESLPYDEYRDQKSKDHLIDEILRWIVLYVANFGDFRADRVKHWFFASRVMDVLQLDLASLNRYAAGAILADVNAGDPACSAYA